jgi:hypothetical protein
MGIVACNDDSSDVSTNASGPASQTAVTTGAAGLGGGGGGGSGGLGGAGAGATGGGGSGGSGLPEGSACDLLAQDCAAGLECGLLPQQGAQWCEAVCRPASGDGQLGDPCTKDDLNNCSVDTCGEGLYCTAGGFYTQSDPSTFERYCRAYCRVDSDCEPGERCNVGPLQNGDGGYCLPGCPGPGEGCRPTMDCSQLVYGVGTNFLICHEPGPAALGEPCQGPVCAAGTLCENLDAALIPPVCTAICDDAHPCAAGDCVPLGLPQNGGYCPP